MCKVLLSNIFFYAMLSKNVFSSRRKELDVLKMYGIELKRNDIKVPEKRLLGNLCKRLGTSKSE